MGLIHALPTRLARLAALFPRWDALLFPGYRQPGRGHRPWLSTGNEGLFISKLLPLFAVVALLAMHWAG